jgi:hypothetical protein
MLKFVILIKGLRNKRKAPDEKKKVFVDLHQGCFVESVVSHNDCRGSL